MKIRTYAAALTVAALTGSLALAAPATAASRTAVVADAVSYLDGQIVGGTNYESYGAPDQGLTADGVFALLSANDATHASALTNWLGSQVDAYVDPTDATGYGPASGAAAKLAIVAEATDGDPHDFGTSHSDLLKIITDNVCTGPTAPVDSFGDTKCSALGDVSFAFSGISQALAVLALQASPVAADHLSSTSPVVTRLHQLQCADGGFSSDLITAGQACASDVDTTAYAVQALATVKGTDLWLGAAQSYLQHAQQSNGDFANPAAGSGGNANSTGLAAQALQTLIQSAYASTPAATGQVSAVPAEQWQRAVNRLVATELNGGGWPASGQTAADVRATTQALPAVALTTLHDELGVPFAATARHAVPALAVSRTPSTVLVTSNARLTITVSAPGAIVNGAKIAVKLGSTPLASGAVTAGRVVLTLPRLAAGMHVLTVAYGGTANTSPVSKSYAINVLKVPSHLAISKSPSTVRTSTRARLTVKVAATGANVNGGRITVKLGAKTLARGTVRSGRAVLTLPRLTRGTHRLKIAYTGTSTVAAKSVTYSIRVK